MAGQQKIRRKIKSNKIMTILYGCTYKVIFYCGSSKSKHQQVFELEEEEILCCAKWPQDFRFVN
jgi:hypothetical protein